MNYLGFLRITEATKTSGSDTFRYIALYNEQACNGIYLYSGKTVVPHQARSGYPLTQANVATAWYRLKSNTTMCA
ncbi:hypothetical protein MUCCIDRAFT_111645 [Mucor lusitanicus CBS 277.49]|uniref:Uncharacterized protein n=1 Tax=Mucor lusitanicus CBS 277.49 TaxID=747725 RepID=A0A168KDH6_MUCCL|nr:hypothetical protein MUCCIDRAFT_111645 [Mucor lusitanicus CBS 277.49]